MKQEDIAKAQNQINRLTKLLREMGPSDNPIKYAFFSFELGNTYYSISTVHNDREFCILQAIDSYKNAVKAFKDAINYYKAGLTVFTKTGYPKEYITNLVMVQYNLGQAYRALAEIRDREKNLKLSLQACEEAEDVMHEYPDGKV